MMERTNSAILAAAQKLGYSIDQTGLAGAGIFEW